MTLHAKDIMVTEFETIYQEDPAGKAIERISQGTIRKTGYKTVSVMVIDDLKKLVGVVSMFDILYHLRPDFLNFGINSEELKWEGQLNILIEKFKDKKVDQIMSRNVVGASKDDHIMVILDRMVKNRYRRLPILQNDRPVGIVYISDIYHRLFSQGS